MESIADFELTARQGDDGAGDDGAGPSALTYRGKPAPVEIAGSVLDAQYRCSPGFLLISNEDSPYEEGLHITLLSPGLAVLDRLEMSHAYAPGLLRDLRIAGEDALEFSFFGGDSWRLTVLANPRRWSPGQLTPGVAQRWRRLLRKGYLDLRRLDK